MSGRKNTLAWLGDGRLAAEIQPLYDEFGPMLTATFARKFGMPARDAQAVLEEVFIAFMGVQSQIADRQTWLVVYACDAAAEWQRRKGRGGVAERQAAESLDDVRTAILHTPTVRERLTALPAPQREAVRLRYLEDLPYEEIGARMRMSAGAARELVKDGVKRLLSIGRGKP